LDLVTLVVDLLLTLLFIALNGFFVAAEFAIVKVRGTQLARSAQGGELKGKRAQHIVAHVDEYLAACQLGITLASLALGWIGEPAFAALLSPVFGFVGILSPAAQSTLAFLFGFAILTAIHVILGEQAPKYYALERPTGTALEIAGPLDLFFGVFRPVVQGLSAASRWLLRFIGIREVRHEAAHTEQELRILLTSALTTAQAQMVTAVFDLRKLKAKDVMTPRNRIVALDLAHTFEQNLLIADESGYSRFPLIDGNMEQVVGLVHIRDLIQLARSAVVPKDLRAIRRDVLFVPEGRHVEDVLADLLRRGRHMAIVSDEFGTTAGLLTMEDIFEELFGEIRDEFDVAESEQAWRKLGEGHFLMDAQMPLHDAEEVLGIPLPSDEASTLAGYVVNLVGRLPAKGERLLIGPYHAIVREVDRKRIKLVELWRPRAGRGPSEDAAGRAGTVLDEDHPEGFANAPSHSRKAPK
jgi:CBS domain containing-hemolysin-like protein